MKLYSLFLTLIILSFTNSASSQNFFDEMQQMIDAEIDSLTALESPIEVKVKLTTDLSTPDISDGMETTIDFKIQKVLKGNYDQPTIRIFMGNDRKGILEEGFKKDGTYTLKVIKHFGLTEAQPGGPDMEVLFLKEYVRM